MLENYPYHQRQRNPNRFDWRDVAGWAICGLAVTYLLAAGVLGLLAR